MRPIDIALKVSGVSAVTSGFDTVASKAQQMAGKVGGAVTKIKSSVDDVTGSLKQLGSSDGFNQAASKANTYWKSVDTAREKTEGLTRSLEGIRNAGAALTVASAGGIMLSNSFIKVYQEGAKADEMLKSMLQKAGEGQQFEQMAKWAGDLSRQAAMVDDDPIKQAAAGLLGFGLNAKQVQEVMPGLIGQSRLYGQSLDSVSMAFGKAFASGNAGSLRRIGVTLDESQLARIKAATAGIERQAVMFEVVKESMARYALGITQGMSESEMAANRFANAMDEAQTNIGEGSATVQQGITGIVARLLALGNAAPETEKVAGGMLTLGSYVGAATGTIVTLGSQIGLTMLAMQNMSITGATAFATIRAAALAALGPIAAIGVGIAAGMAIANSEGWKRIANLGAYNDIWKHLNEVNNDPKASKDFKARTLAEGIEKFQGFGLTSDAEDVKKKYKEVTGKDYVAPNPAADAMAASMAKVQASVSSPASTDATPAAIGAAMPTTASTGAPASGGTTDIRSLQMAIATAPKGQKKALQQQLMMARWAQADDKARDHEQKANDRAAEKVRKTREREADKQERASDTIATAQLNAQTEYQIAVLKSQETKGNKASIARQIAQVKANAILKAGQINGDPTAMQVAQIKAGGLLNASGMQKAGGGVDAGAILRNGGSIFDLPSSNTGAGAMTDSAGGGGGGATTGQLTARNRVQTSVGGWWVRFEPIWIPNPLAQAANALPFTPGFGGF